MTQSPLSHVFYSKTWYQVYRNDGSSFGFCVDDKGIIGNFPIHNLNGEKLTSVNGWFNKKNCKEVVKICVQYEKK